ncbi:MAG: hypothetical protein EHM64_09655 [Ignavibacteriae bacterium]|nr:MAG: hypothetical protein EHM64_09655 [Ignavibacteriota bacterium]
MRHVQFIILSLVTLLNLISFGCKKSPADSSAVETPTEQAVLPVDTPAFGFVLYDGLSTEAAAPIHLKLRQQAPRILSDFKVAQADTYRVYLWGSTDSYLDAQQQLIGTRYPGSTGYVLGPSAMGLLNVSTAANNAVHEYVHSLSLRINGNFGNNPRWCWEAVALYESGGFVDPRNVQYLLDGQYPSLNELNLDFNAGSQKIYQVGYLLVEFIKTRWGFASVIELIKQNGNVQSVFGKTNAEFEAVWKQFVEAKYFLR